jgi:hypothetical protein
MKNKQKGFSTLLGLLFFMVLVGAGLYLYIEKTSKEISLPDVNPPVVGGDKDAHGCIGSAGYSWCEAKNKCLRVWEEKCEVSSTSVACTMDAMQCPDGSYVGRTGPDCQFVCPNTTETITLFIQNKEIARTSDCGVTQQISKIIPKTNNLIDSAVKVLFEDELSNYGVYEKVEISNKVAKVFLKSENMPSGRLITGLSSCENQHLFSILKDTISYYQKIETVEIYSPKGKIEF